MEKKFIYINDDLPIKKVTLSINGNTKQLLQVCNGKWETTSVISSTKDTYHYIIDDFFWIPDDSHKYTIQDDSITSICEPNNFNNVQINEVFCCEDIVYNEKTQKYKPVNKITMVNDLKEYFFVWCNFSNVKKNVILTLEIYTENEIFDIINVILRESSFEKNYKCSFFCCIPTSYFMKTNTWNIKVRISESNTKVLSMNIKKLSTQLYSMQTIKKY